MLHNGTESRSSEGDVGQLSVESVPDPEVLSLVGVPEWCDSRHVAVAWALSEGATKQAAADAGGVSRKSVYRWLKRPEFSRLVDRLTLHTGIATRAGQLLEVKRLWNRVKDEDLDRALRKSDAVTLLRLAGELGAGGAVTVPLGAQAAQKIIIGTQINVQGTVMSGSPAQNPTGGVEIEDPELVEIEVGDLGAAAGDRAPPAAGSDGVER